MSYRSQGSAWYGMLMGVGGGSECVALVISRGVRLVAGLLVDCKSSSMDAKEQRLKQLFISYGLMSPMLIETRRNHQPGLVAVRYYNSAS